jgi:hypothetical protein
MAVKVYCDSCGSDGAERTYWNFSCGKVVWPQTNPDLCEKCARKLAAAAELVLGPMPKAAR